MPQTQSFQLQALSWYERLLVVITACDLGSANNMLDNVVTILLTIALLSLLCHVMSQPLNTYSFD